MNIRSHGYQLTFLLLGGLLLSGELLAAENTAANTAKRQSSRSTSPVQEIVVTATKEGEVDPQQIPYAISVFDRESIKNTGTDNIEDLELQTPGLNVSRNGQAARLYIRGIGTNLDFIGADPSVTVHVDGVYESRPTTALEQFLDVARVEVLRGPQGTLYGRNSTGGTINIITRLPDNESRAQASMEIGSYRYANVTASASGALISDTLYGGLAVMKTNHDPYVDNKSGNGVDGLLDDDSLNSRATLRWKDSDREAILRLDYAETDRATGAYKPTGKSTTGSPSPLANQLDQPEGFHEIAISFQDPGVEQINAGAAVEVRIPLSDSLSLTSLTAYRKIDYRTAEDTDGSRLDVLVTEIDDQQYQWSEELRLNYQKDRLGLVGGLYYLQEHHESDARVNINLAGIASVFDVENDTTAQAAFFNGTLAVTDQLNLSAGLRYSREEKDFADVRQTASGTGTATVFDIDDTETWDSWSPKFSLDYTTESGSLLYGTVSRGFKSGGYNFTLADGKYDPEYVTAYELGLKKQWPDAGLRSNLVLFYYDYDDLQVSDFTEVGAPRISNAAEASIRGFEVENRWVPSLDWLFELNFAFLSAEYDDYEAPRTPTQRVDVSGNALNAAPRRKLYLAAQYFQDISRGTLSYRLEYGWQTRQYFTAFNEEVSSQPTYGLFNARLSFRSVGDQWEVQFYGENLGDKEYSTSSREFTATTVGVTRDINPPRTFGATLIYHIL